MPDFALPDFIDLAFMRDWLGSSSGGSSRDSRNDASSDEARTMRPPFEMAVRFWRAHLDVIRPEEPLNWVFRENLRVGGVGEDHLSATVTVCPEAPCFDRADAAALYEQAHAEGCEDLCFELLYAAPGQIFATLRRGRGLEPFTLEREDWDLEFQLAPTFHAVTEIADPEELRAPSRADPVADDLLADILIGGDVQ